MYSSWIHDSGTINTVNYWVELTAFGNWITLFDLTPWNLQSAYKKINSKYNWSLASRSIYKYYCQDFVSGVFSESARENI
jgi:hypothetical protein